MNPSGSCTYLACKGLKLQVVWSTCHPWPGAALSCSVASFRTAWGGLITKAVLVPPQGGLLRLQEAHCQHVKGSMGPLLVTTGSEGRAEVG